MNFALVLVSALEWILWIERRITEIEKQLHQREKTIGNIVDVYCSAVDQVYIKYVRVIHTATGRGVVFVVRVLCTLAVPRVHGILPVHVVCSGCVDVFSVIVVRPMLHCVRLSQVVGPVLRHAGNLC